MDDDFILMNTPKSKYTLECGKCSDLERQLSDAKEQLAAVVMVGKGAVDAVEELQKRIEAQDRTIALLDTALIEADKRIEKLEACVRAAPINPCPWCDCTEIKEFGHGLDCRRQEALGEK